MENVNDNVMPNDNVNSKLIFNAAVAKSLIEDYGHRVIGIKPNRENADKTVFVFEKTVELLEDMQKISKKRRESFRANRSVEKPEQED